MAYGLLGAGAIAVGLLSRANTRDANEPEIVAALRAAGASVERVDTPCDLIVGYRGVTYLVEVKLPAGPRGGMSHSKLTDEQVKFAAQHKGRYVVVRTCEDALRAIGAIKSGIVSGGRE